MTDDASPRRRNGATKATRFAAILACYLACCLVWAITGPAGAAEQLSSGSVRAPDAGGGAVMTAPGTVPGNVSGAVSDADIWRQIRRGQAFRLSGTNLGSPSLIRSGGEEWRVWHNAYIQEYGAWVLLAALGAMVLFALIRGKVRIEGGRGGRRINRFSELERMIHWFVAATFILLAISGLVLMFGKFVLTPVVGAKAFGIIASACMHGHNLFGPMFVVGIAAMFVFYVKDNFPRLVDFVWVFKGGIFFAGHASSWKFNMGEKVWFWIAVTTGAALSVSGIVLDFPMLLADKAQLPLANLVHGSAAIIAIAPAILHIYLGTIGVEGALEGMTAGKVDVNWAIEHHDLWAKAALNEADADSVPAGPAAQPAE